MKNNLLPFGIIAIVGVFVAIIVFYVGLDTKQKREAGEEEGSVELAEPEEIYAQSCAGCHGKDLSGNNGPDLQKVGDSFSAEEIRDIILEGYGDMPPVQLSPEESEALSEWLVEGQ